MKLQNVNLKKALCVLLCSLTTASIIPAWAENAAAAPQEDAKEVYKLADNIQDGVILHCFSWKYSDVRDALPEIAAAGFTSVQVSPIQIPASSAYPWYIVYQPRD